MQSSFCVGPMLLDRVIARQYVNPWPLFFGMNPTVRARPAVAVLGLALSGHADMPLTKLVLRFL